mgnify:CR=1 FL=1
MLVKVLSGTSPLSLQPHPGTEQARRGFAKENAAGLALDDPRRNYRDDRAKPEMLIALVALALVSTLWFRDWFHPEAMVFPPAHYVARTAAGGLLWAVLAAMWLYVAWQGDTPRLIGILREKAVGRRLATAMVALVVAAAVPDIALTRLWSGYLEFYGGVVRGHTGLISVATLPGRIWPWWLFNQQWSVPALSALLRTAPDQAIVLAVEGPTDTPPFDSRCGTLPKLKGYRWVD